MVNSKRKRGATIAVVCMLPVAYVLAAATYQSRLAPAPDVKTFAQLKAQGMPLTRAVRVTNPPNHFIVFGDMALWTLPSGSPAYLFDESGWLVDFTCDVGDSTTFQNKYNVYSGTEVDIRTVDGRFSENPEQASTAKDQQ